MWSNFLPFLSATEVEESVQRTNIPEQKAPKKGKLRGKRGISKFKIE